MGTFKGNVIWSAAGLGGFGAPGASNPPPVTGTLFFNGNQALPGSWNTATQSTGSLQPTQESFNTQQVVRFTSTKYYTLTDDSWIDHANDVTIFMPFLPDDGRPASEEKIFGSTDFNISIQTDGKLKVVYETVTATSKWPVLPNGTPTDMVNLMLWLDRTTETIRVYFNTVELAMENNDTTGVSYASVVDIEIGNGYNGLIGDIWILNTTLAAANQTLMWDFFGPAPRTFNYTAVLPVVSSPGADILMM